MKKGIFTSLLIVILLYLSSCSSSETIDSIDYDKLDEIKVSKIKDVTTEEDFIFRLFSEKEQYSVGEDVKLYGELVYIGDEDKITITHAASAIHYSIEEKLRGNHIPDIVSEIAIYRDLKRGIPHKETYQKGAEFLLGDESVGYKKFMDVFLNEKGFPAGYYVVKGYADFATNLPDDEDGIGHFKIEAQIDFKVQN